MVAVGKGGSLPHLNLFAIVLFSCLTLLLVLTLNMLVAFSDLGGLRVDDFVGESWVSSSTRYLSYWEKLRLLERLPGKRLFSVNAAGLTADCKEVRPVSEESSEAEEEVRACWLSIVTAESALELLGCSEVDGRDETISIPSAAALAASFSSTSVSATLAGCARTSRT